MDEENRIINDIRVADTEELLSGALVCPSCPESRPGRCCGCKGTIAREHQMLDADPFSAEIHDDMSLHLQCGNCAHESAMDI